MIKIAKAVNYPPIRLTDSDKLTHQKLFNYLIKRNIKCQLHSMQLTFDNLSYLNYQFIDVEDEYLYARKRIEDNFNGTLRDFISSEDQLKNKYLTMIKYWVMHDNEIIDRTLDRYETSIDINHIEYNSNKIADSSEGLIKLDYGTRALTSIYEPFDITKCCTASNRRYINPEYNEFCKKHLGSYGIIQYMSADAYYKHCQEYCYRDLSLDQLIRSRKIGLSSYISVLKNEKSTFPIPFIDTRNDRFHGQEGLHRMQAAAELTSWETKFPVLIIKKV